MVTHIINLDQIIEINFYEEVPQTEKRKFKARNLCISYIQRGYLQLNAEVYTKESVLKAFEDIQNALKRRKHYVTIKLDLNDE